MKKTALWILTLLLAFQLCACGAGPMSGASAQSAAPMDGSSESYPGDASGESYLTIDQNSEVPTQENSMLTFSLKVDTAAYSNVQRFLEAGELPPADAVRTEELINYFNYEGAVEPATRKQPFSLYTEVAPSPFDSAKHLAFVRVKTPDIDRSDLPAGNLVFLIDTSGSMESYDKLPLLRQAFALLAESLTEQDRVSIVTYAGSSDVVLSGARGNDTRRIVEALEGLQAQGSTAGADGINTAYEMAEEYFIKGGNNRVILATDGDFNVGPSTNEALSDLIREKSEGGIYLSILGFGTDNIRDDLMETLSKDGNGNYAYLNSLRTAQKVLVEELSSSLYTVADDVKAQIEFNPQNVASYRLIGYENRALSNKDFTDDKKDAGEIGVGTDVVMLFELTLHGAPADDTGMKYKPQSEAPTRAPADGAYGDELFEVRIRYKNPGRTDSRQVTQPVSFEAVQAQGSSDLQFAASVAQFGELLRGSDFVQVNGAREIVSVAKENLGRDNGGYRKEFVELLRQYERIAD